MKLTCSIREHLGEPMKGFVVLTMLVSAYISACSGEVSGTTTLPPDTIDVVITHVGANSQTKHPVTVPHREQSDDCQIHIYS